MDELNSTMPSRRLTRKRGKKLGRSSGSRGSLSLEFIQRIFYSGPTSEGQTRVDSCLKDQHTKRWRRERNSAALRAGQMYRFCPDTIRIESNRKRNGRDAGPARYAENIYFKRELYFFPSPRGEQNSIGGCRSRRRRMCVCSNSVDDL